MKLIIAGGRYYHFQDAEFRLLNAIRELYDVREVVSGGAKGADKCGEMWAKSYGIPVKLFPAQWDKHGKAAGPMRNKAMAQYADAVIIFPGGRGSESMYREAQFAAIKVFDFTDAGK